MSTQASAATVSGRSEVLDEDHLRRMTLGDRALESEVLQIFVRQSALLVGRIVDAEPAIAAAAAHTLSGSARGIGAWRVAKAGERLEHALRRSADEAIGRARVELEAATLEASAVIGSHLARQFDRAQA